MAAGSSERISMDTRIRELKKAYPSCARYLRELERLRKEVDSVPLKKIHGEQLLGKYPLSQTRAIPGPAGWQGLRQQGLLVRHRGADSVAVVLLYA